MKDNYIIVVAGGMGLRMGAEFPKQFLPIGGKPILMHTLELFSAWGNLILVLPADFRDLWDKLCTQHQFEVPHQVVDGGGERFESVANALKLVPDNVLVAVHDGVRPFVSRETVMRAFETAAKTGSAVPVMKLTSSLRRIDGDKSLSVDRRSYRVVQTPQVFYSHLLKQAYEQPFRPSFTDDASVFEAMGHTVTLTEGNPENIKITTPTDYRIAETLLLYGPY
ncbi:MAG: 2-C-methyl-D-erythritol 4-phosphate cytidylyltransferase [Paludibacteraceae bacterium]|nr:2-C-methyl-D-erythritol 4-phosphate cytidylyltransferase [Paludibacteraceae bacterium]